jgi:hypothetical protein
MANYCRAVTKSLRGTFTYFPHVHMLHMHMSLTKLSLAGNGKTANLFYGVPVRKLLVLHVSYIFEMFLAYMVFMYIWHVPPLLM